MPFFYQSGVFVMEEIAISKFKATCLAVLEKVKKTGQPILVTRFGHPGAQITPPAPAKRAPKFGTAAGSFTILGDIVGPISHSSHSGAARDPYAANLSATCATRTT